MDRQKGLLYKYFEALQMLYFKPINPKKKKKKVKSISRSSSPSKATISLTAFQALILLGTLVPLAINLQPLNIILLAMAHQALQPPVPWGAPIGPLALGNQLHDMPISSQKILPKFFGDGKVTID